MTNSDHPRNGTSLTTVFVIDAIETLVPGHDTSVALMEAAQLRGHRVLVTTASGLGFRDGTVTAACAAVRLRPAVLHEGHWMTDAEWFSVGGSFEFHLADADVVFMRTDPPVDADYLRATYLLDLIDPDDTLVVNAPAGLRDANEKLFLLQIPDVLGSAEHDAITPPTLVTSDREQIRTTVADWGRAVLKPTDFMGGRGVMLLDPDDPNLGSIVDTSTDRGRTQVVVQKWIEEVETTGDRRLILLDGVPMGAIRRMATESDFRCNMAAGGVPIADVVTNRDREICVRIAPFLRRHGLHFVGLDVIGQFLTEINVTSPTGVREIDAADEGHLAQDVIVWAEARRSAGIGTGSGAEDLAR